VNIFVIPSWFPSASSPMAGLFVRDQVAALALARPAWTQVLGLWGHHDGALSLRSASASANALRWRVRARATWREGAAWQEALTPRLSWTLAVAGGGAAGLLRATRRNLAEAEKRCGPMQLMHAHVGFPAGWMASVLSKERGLPYVLTEHMSPFPVAPLLDAQGGVVAPLRQAFEGAAATVAVSTALADRLRACGLPCSDVIPNVVDETRFALAPCAPSAPLVLLTLGALTPQKGVDLLLQAFARWQPTAGDVQLHIGGDGSERVRLQALAHSLGVSARVRWLGALAPAQVPACMAACDAFVLASRHESFGVVLVEALMSGKPLLATRCGGPEGIVGNSNGVLVDANSVDALVQGLTTLQHQITRWQPALLRAAAIARFGRLAVGAQWEALVDRVVRA
jgi:glycosyltransferase involved in cell wall biosynthesis